LTNEDFVITPVFIEAGNFEKEVNKRGENRNFPLPQTKTFYEKFNKISEILQ